MPAGVVRVYQADSKGGTQFVGEDRIGHTPKDETLNLRIGNAFDVVAERKQIDFERIATNVFEVEYEVVLRNHKTTAITVEVNEPIGGTWRISAVIASVDEDRCVGRAIQRAGGSRGHRDAQLPCAGHVLTRGSITKLNHGVRSQSSRTRFHRVLGSRGSRVTGFANSVEPRRGTLCGNPVAEPRDRCGLWYTLLLPARPPFA